MLCADGIAVEGCVYASWWDVNCADGVGWRDMCMHQGVVSGMLMALHWRAVGMHQGVMFGVPMGLH